ncbi:carboxypeptidase M32 [Candidatus Bathyarchaeota archaeon]|nr:MAG: carboxypeptidase M32 [Candidatus Bathyarchaeota archaeon]
MSVSNELLSKYQQLMEKFKNIAVFRSAVSILHWDMETKMPPKGIMLRSQQMALLSQIEHKMVTDPEIGKLIEEIMDHPEYECLDQIQKRNVYLFKKEYEEQTALPEKLVVEIARQRTITTDVWKKAKAAKDFSMFKPELEKLFELIKKAAEILMEVKKTPTPYDALIDIFEPKMTAEMITKIFDGLKAGLTSLIDKCLSSPIKPDTSFLRRRIPIDTQRKIAVELARFIGYDVESKEAGGRIDETEHPFTTGYYHDVRITTHYYEDNWASSFFSVLHEGGHALYEQNLPTEWIYQPVGTACSSGFHESQSRFVENIVGRSREFWIYFLPKLNAITANAFADVDLDTFVRGVNEVKPSKIRVEADEVTYCLHIIIRFEIERDLFAGKLAIEELPQVWNEKYEKYLGVKIENDSEGVMQDTHWASGLFGYFPSYALGNIYSGQLLAKMQKDIPEWKTQLAEGNFKQIKQWLIKNVHSYGNLYDPADLIRIITGEEIDVEHYLRYLNEKYARLYGF